MFLLPLIGGRRNNITLPKLLQFITGEDEELVFGLQITSIIGIYQCTKQTFFTNSKHLYQYVEAANSHSNNSQAIYRSSA